MAADNEETNYGSLLLNEDNSNPDNVRFDLDGSHHPDESDASLDEVDEFLELSTMSNFRSTSSVDSTSHSTTNGSIYQSKQSSINEMNNEKTAKLQRYTR